MKKIDTGKWMSAGILCALLLCVGVEGRAEEAGETGTASAWTRVETTSRGNFKVGDGDAVYIRSEDISNLAEGLNLLGTEFKAVSRETSQDLKRLEEDTEDGMETLMTRVEEKLEAEAKAREEAIRAEEQARKQEDSAIKSSLSEETSAGSQEISSFNGKLEQEAAARAQGDQSLQESINAEAQAREAKDAELLQTMQEGLGGLQTSFQDGVGKLCEKLAALGCTPEDYKPSADPPVYPSPEAICAKLDSLYDAGYAEGKKATGVKSQTIIFTPKLTYDGNYHNKATVVKTFDQLERIDGFRVIREGAVYRTDYELQNNNEILIRIDNLTLETCDPYEIIAYQIDEG